MVRKFLLTLGCTIVAGSALASSACRVAGTGPTHGNPISLPGLWKIDNRTVTVDAITDDQFCWQDGSFPIASDLIDLGGGKWRIKLGAVGDEADGERIGDSFYFQRSAGSKWGAMRFEIHVLDFAHIQTIETNFDPAARLEYFETRSYVKIE